MRTAAKSSARAAHAARHGFLQLDNEEGALLFQAMQIRRGESIYRPLDNPPYIAGTYTPLYMAAVAALDDFQFVGFGKGRYLVWGSALGACCLLILLIVGTTRNAPLGILAGVGFMATYEVYRWIGYFRVDFPALFLSLAGLSIVVLSNGKRVGLIVGAFFMILALYTKQTMIAVPLSCLIALMIHNGWRRGAWFAGALLLFGLPPLILLHFATDGQFLRHIVLYNMNTFSESDLLVWIRHAWNIHRGLVIAGFCGLPWLVWLGWQFRTRDDRDCKPVVFGFWQPLLYFGLLAQWNIFGAAKAGSAGNYLLEPLAGWILLLAFAAGTAIRWVALVHSPLRGQTFAMITSLAILAGVAAQTRMIISPFFQERLFSPYINATAMDFQASREVLSLIREAKTPFTELAGFTLQTKRDPVFQPFIMSELARQGRWDQSQFVRDIEGGKFDLVVAQQDLTQLQVPIEYTEQILKAFRSAYELDRTISGRLWTYYILRPKSSNLGGENPISNIAMVND